MEKVLTIYQAPVDSFPLSESRIGIFPAGRYTGFDAIKIGPAGSGIPIILYNSDDSHPSTDSSNLEEELFGAIMTPHGLVIKSSDEYTFTLSANTTLPMRKDVLYAEYQWADDPLGGSLLWGVIEGTVDGEIPALTNPEIQVRLGVIDVPQDAAFADLSYTPDPCPIAKVESTNRYFRTESWNAQEKALSVDGEGHVIVGNDGNTFLLTGNPATTYVIKGFIPVAGAHFPIGTSLKVAFLAIGGGSTFSALATSLGYHINFDLVDPQNDGAESLPIRLGGIYEFTLLEGGSWALTNMITDALYLVQTFNNRLIIVEAKTTRTTLPVTLEAGVTLDNLARTPYATKVDGMAQVEMGIIYNVTVAPPGATPVATVPAGYRPTREVIGLVYGYASGSGLAPIIRYRISTSGEVALLSVTETLETGPIIVYILTPPYPTSALIS